MKFVTAHEDLIVRVPRRLAHLLVPHTGRPRIPTLFSPPQHDVQLDFYGKRLATCSSDRLIKVCPGRTRSRPAASLLSLVGFTRTPEPHIAADGLTLRDILQVYEADDQQQQQPAELIGHNGVHTLIPCAGAAVAPERLQSKTLSTNLKGGDNLLRIAL